MRDLRRDLSSVVAVWRAKGYFTAVQVSRRALVTVKSSRVRAQIASQIAGYDDCRTALLLLWFRDYSARVDPRRSSRSTEVFLTYPTQQELATQASVFYRR